VFGNSTGLDACPFLRERAQTAGGAICVPVGIAGRNLGVLHAVVPPGEDLDPEGIRDVQLIARKAGDRLGILRVLARTEAQAQTDPLTGLPNRRSLEDQARSVLDDDVPYVVAFADLDHFKNLNDAHGHELGDRALRMFARVLRDSVRPNDVPARFGGEEFVVVLPDCSVDDARRVAARIRERLVDALSVAAFPPFTLSIGLAPSQPGRSFTDTLGRADEALMVAKKSGRDRIVVYGEEPPPSAPGSGESVPTITTLRPGA
jgi:diguanylate cyclase